MQIQCPSCQTRYDVSGRPAGTAVSCHCGETFGFPRAPQAPVSLQCQGCGAAADPGIGRCPYCDSPLRSVCCPNCFTLMVAGDRHCGQCGTRVVAPALYRHRDGAITLPCPRCTVPMTANLVHDQIFDRCDRCGGIWAHHLAVEAVLDSRKTKRSVHAWLDGLSGPREYVEGTDRSLQCPDCERPMTTCQLPKNKRVDIDLCARHGIWFDHREIRTLTGGRSPKKKRLREAKYRPVRKRSHFAEFLRDADDWWPWEALEELLELLEDVFD